MDEYTIYCTEEQTKKAFGLGAPISKNIDWVLGHNSKLVNNGIKGFNTPTAEQMIGWIRKEHKIHVRIDCEGSENYVTQLQFIHSSKDLDVANKYYKGIIGNPGFPSPEEATLAAIDTALEYITNNKK